MSLNRGLTTTRGSDAPKFLKIKSVFPVAIVLIASLEEKLWQFDSPEKALKYFTDNVTKPDGNWKKYLDLWEGRFKTTVPIIVSTVKPLKDAAAQKAKILTAIDNLKQCRAKFDMKPDIITVPDFPKDITVAKSMIAIATIFKARCYYDIDATALADATTFRTNFGSERLSLIKSALGTFNTTTKVNEFYDAGTVATFFRAMLDGTEQYGWFKSLSNRPVPMDSIKNPTEFHDGLDETDPLTEIQVWAVVKNQGIRFWSSDATCSADTTWRDALTVRIVDMMSETVRRDLANSIDKDLAEISVIKNSVQAFSNGLIGAGLLLGGSIYLDEAKTTKEMIAAGEFEFVFDFQEAPKIRRVNIHFNRVNSYSSVVYKMLEEV